MGKETTLYNGDMTPLVRSTSRQKWQRIPRRLLFYHRSLVHRGRKILSLAFGFDREEDVYQFAAAAPYSYSRLQKHLATWQKRSQAFATREEIAQTTQKRRIDLITIGDLSFKDKENKEELNPAKVKTGETKRRIVLILARSHGGHPPASFICQGFLDYMGSSSEKACALRNGIVIQVVPMVNPDGVFLGNQRSDLLGSDLNRCWNRATSFAHPALVAINDLIAKLTSEKTLQLDFIIDLHADVSHEGVFVRGNSYDDVYRFERHAVLPKFLGTRIEAWQVDTCYYNADPNLAGSARRALPTGTIDAYSLLASLGGRRLTPQGPYLHYTEDAYAKIGRSLAKALCDYYRHIGVIPPRVGAASKKKDQRGRRRRKRPVYERERLWKQHRNICFVFMSQIKEIYADTLRPDISITLKKSPSSSPERRVLPARVLSPPLPATPPPVTRALPPRTACRRTLRPRPKTVQAGDNVLRDNLLPVITGTAVRTPRLTVVDLSAYIRPPAPAARAPRPRRPARRSPRTPPRRSPRPRARRSSAECDTHDSRS